MCSPMKLARVATIGVATAGLAGCINVGSNFNVFGDGNTQVTGDGRAPCTDDALTARICREYHEHTDTCVRQAPQSEPCDPLWFASQPVPSNYLKQSQFFACNDFEDRNHNGADVSDVIGGPRNMFKTDEPVMLVGWELSEKPLRFFFEYSGNQPILQRKWPGRRGGYYVNFPANVLPTGTYTVRWERDECGAGQWTERARQTIRVIDCTPCVTREPTRAPAPERYRGSGIIESIK